MSEFYKHKESGLIVRHVEASEDHVYVTLPHGLEVRLGMNSVEFDEQFETCKIREVDLDNTVLGPSELDLYFMEYVPAGFAGDDRLLKLVVSYDEIIEAFLHRTVDEDGNPVEMKE